MISEGVYARYLHGAMGDQGIGTPELGAFKAGTEQLAAAALDAVSRLGLITREWGGAVRRHVLGRHHVLELVARGGLPQLELAALVVAAGGIGAGLVDGLGEHLAAEAGDPGGVASEVVDPEVQHRRLVGGPGSHPEREQGVGDVGVLVAGVALLGDPAEQLAVEPPAGGGVRHGERDVADLDDRASGCAVP